MRLHSGFIFTVGLSKRNARSFRATRPLMTTRGSLNARQDDEIEKDTNTKTSSVEPKSLAGQQQCRALPLFDSGLLAARSDNIE
jgi:hypothetical protein